MRKLFPSNLLPLLSDPPSIDSTHDWEPFFSPSLPGCPPFIFCRVSEGFSSPTLGFQYPNPTQFCLTSGLFFAPLSRFCDATQNRNLMRPCSFHRFPRGPLEEVMEPNPDALRPPPFPLPSPRIDVELTTTRSFPCEVCSFEVVGNPVPTKPLVIAPSPQIFLANYPFLTEFALLPPSLLVE